MSTRAAGQRLTGRRVLLTGASSGIGAALAYELAREGARLLLTARRHDRLDALAQELASAGGEAHVVIGDITSADCRGECLQQAMTRLGGLDILINNAGVGATGPFASANEARFRRVMEVNLFAPAELSRAALPLLKAGHAPMIVNIGSIVAHRALPGAAEYSASKGALRSFSDALRIELAAAGIHVLLVSPGSTESEFFENLVERGEAPAIRANRPTPACAVARRIVRAILGKKRELFPSLQARAVDLAQRLSPGIVEAMLARKYQRRE